MTLYELLGLRPDASLAEVRRAYQRLARRLHPAVNPGDPESARRFAEVTRAYEVLSDPQRRARYDRGGEARPAAPAVPEVGFAGFDFSADVRTGEVGFRQIFGGMFETRARVSQDRRGEDLEQSARISFDECVRGTHRRVQLVRLDRCGACGGRGELATDPSPCAACAGTGEVRTRRGRMVFTRRCPACEGAQVQRSRPCARCGSEGRVMQSEWLDVEIPPGVADKARLTLPGFGNAGRRGGPAGDFHLQVHVDAHPLFRRDGEDLQCEVPLTITEAALGAHVEVATPYGPVTIEVPAGTQAGQRFRLRKRGLPRPAGGRGDLFVEARVWVPPVRDEESRELLREFARRNPQDPRQTAPPPPAAREA